MITLNQISKSFDKQVLKDLNFQIYPGKITAFLGPNGAGKTTTIKIITGLLTPDSGTVNVFNNVANPDNLEIKKLITYIPDVPYLYEYLTGKEFLYLIASLFKLNKDDLDEKIAEALSYFEINQISEQLISTYSHGLKQRLVFSMAKLRNSEVLIIDEPMVGLDPKTSLIFKNYLKGEKAKNKIIFISTHQLNIAAELADELLIIKSGNIVYNSSKDQKDFQNEKNLEDFFLNLTI